jgi:class 3 adenylate cyclase
VKWIRPSRWPLATQFIVILSLTTAGLAGVVGELAAQRDEVYLRGQMERQYNLMLDNLKVTASAAIAAEDIALLQHMVGQLGQSDQSLHALDILNAEGRLLVTWNRPLQEGAEPVTLADRQVFLDGVLQGTIKTRIDLTDGLLEVSTRTSETRLIMGLFLLVMAFAIAGLIYRLALVPIGAIDRRIRSLRSGDLCDDFDITASSEFFYIADALNGFARQITERQALDAAHRDELSELNLSYLRFVPKQFLEHLHRQSITAVKHGDQVQRTMTVLFSDIRAFTNLSEQIGPAKTFAFLNEFLGRIGPVVRKHNGFIDKYIGDAIMALFDMPCDAVAASIEMLETLSEMNRERVASDEAPIRIGIGLNTGELMLGIVGEDRRMEGTVIGDAVNLAARLEALTKKYGVPLLISEATLTAVETCSEPDKYSGLLDKIRWVDAVQAKGRSKKTRIFEVFAADDEPTQNLKRAHGATIAKILSGAENIEALPASTPGGDPLLSTYHEIVRKGIRDTVSPEEAERDAEEELRWL